MPVTFSTSTRCRLVVYSRAMCCTTSRASVCCTSSCLHETVGLVFDLNSIRFRLRSFCSHIQFLSACVCRLLFAGRSERVVREMTRSVFSYQQKKTPFARRCLFQLVQHISDIFSNLIVTVTEKIGYT